MQPRQMQKRDNPFFIFSPATVTIAQGAMKLFEQNLQRVKSQPSTLAFAEKTVQQVNGKLDMMSKTVTRAYIITFDYNEKLVLLTAIQLYASNLLAAPAHPQRESELASCRQLIAFCAG